ncbi:MAG: fibronectin type III domain-containing protein, partial [Parcubacteria group bacterium]|nr:fibronectin type III domain-containing protein [Parcubacteria group bacterium]
MTKSAKIGDTTTQSGCSNGTYYSPYPTYSPSATYSPSPSPYIGFPAAPYSLTYSIASDGRVTLTWNDNSSNETYFSVYRQFVGGTWASLGTASANIATFIDYNPTQGTTYEYRV